MKYNISAAKNIARFVCLFFKTLCLYLKTSLVNTKALVALFQVTISVLNMDTTKTGPYTIQ